MSDEEFTSMSISDDEFDFILLPSSYTKNKDKSKLTDDKEMANEASIDQNADESFACKSELKIENIESDYDLVSVNCTMIDMDIDSGEDTSVSNFISLKEQKTDSKDEEFECLKITDDIKDEECISHIPSVMHSTLNSKNKTATENVLLLEKNIIANENIAESDNDEEEEVKNTDEKVNASKTENIEAEAEEKMICDSNDAKHKSVFYKHKTFAVKESTDDMRNCSGKELKLSPKKIVNKSTHDLRMFHILEDKEFNSLISDKNQYSSGCYLMFDKELGNDFSNAVQEFFARFLRFCGDD